jgi:peptidoglycan/LPS O-acetylase OafA/YrhL
MAILLVMFHHFQIIPEGTGLQWVLYNLSEFGVHGVDLFFVLSGFLISGILLDSKGHQHYFRNFYIRRTLRIFPLYYAVVVLAVFVLPLLAGGIKNGRLAVPASDLPWYFFYASNFLIAKTSSWRNPVLGVTWSLAIEEQFYLCWALVVYLLSRERLKQVCIGLIVFSAVARIVGVMYGVNPLALYVATPFRLDCLAVGAYIAATWRDPDCWWKESAIVRGVAYLGLLMVLFFYGAGTWRFDFPWTVRVGYSVVAIVSGAWLCTSLSLPQTSVVNRFFSNAFLRFLGKYSYAIYLFHLPIRAAIRDTLFAKPQVHALLGSGLLYQWVFYLVAGAAVIPPVLLSWNLLEKPLLSLKSKFPS